ncbi:kinase-like domain-containing protein [Emericellopsis atlantica]|uniref:Kinase-like domain-containing protein n=1 Tax=Emericellopsis atlantica TaxID=2614577 RepID=A0A9P7ZJS4_9HYPO|nr:kinase-like domain-containing protein [Emericellopsis atlantica]KAG9253011.1 kinase-like domain-containing protein [Emericellopsis atlantica]
MGASGYGDPKQPKAERVAISLLSRHDLQPVSFSPEHWKPVQALWGGYGQVIAFNAEARSAKGAAYMDKLLGRNDGEQGSIYPLVMKIVTPPPGSQTSPSEGDLRKMLSYDVEQYFYEELATTLPSDIPVAKCVASSRTVYDQAEGSAPESQCTAMILTDLSIDFPVDFSKRQMLRPDVAYSALTWLGLFHAKSWDWLPFNPEDVVLPPLVEAQERKGRKRGRSVWRNGGYTYLETRRSEFQDLQEDESSEWSAALCRPHGKHQTPAAVLAASFLSSRGRAFETYIHGDVKSENMFASRDGDQVAFYDFQYVGIGLGVSDLAKLFTCSIPQNMLVEGSVPHRLEMQPKERALLERYREVLLTSEKAPEYEWHEFCRHWETALVDWCRFQASWGLWGNTEWLEARVRSILLDQEWWNWVERAA